MLEYFVMWYLRDWRVLEYFVMLCGVNVTVECLISVIELQEGFIIVHVLLPSLSSWQYLKNRIKLIFKDQIVLQTRKLNDIIYTFIFNIISGRKAYSICVNWGIRPTLHHTIQNMNNKIYVIDCTVHTHDRPCLCCMRDNFQPSGESRTSLCVQHAWHLCFCSLIGQFVLFSAHVILGIVSWTQGFYMCYAIKLY